MKKVGRPKKTFESFGLSAKCGVEHFAQLYVAWSGVGAKKTYEGLIDRCLQMHMSFEDGQAQLLLRVDCKIVCA